MTLGKINESVGLTTVSKLPPWTTTRVTQNSSIIAAINQLGDAINTSGGSTGDTNKYTMSGILENSTGTLRWYPEKTITISGAYFSLGTAGTSTTTFGIRKNDVTVLTVSCGSNVNKSSVAAANVAVTTNDYITVDVLSTGGAEDAVLVLMYS